MKTLYIPVIVLMVVAATIIFTKFNDSAVRDDIVAFISGTRRASQTDDKPVVLDGDDALVFADQDASVSGIIELRGRSTLIIRNARLSFENEILASGESEILVEDAEFVQRGSIELRDRAKLIVRRSIFEIPNTYADAWQFRAKDDSVFVMEESRYRMSKKGWIDFYFFNRAHAAYRDNNDAEGWGAPAGPRHIFSDQTTLKLSKSPFSGSIAKEARWDIADSPFLSLQFGVAPIAVGSKIIHATSSESNLRPKTFIDYWEFPNAGEEHIEYRVVVKNSLVADWGFIVAPHASLVLRDAIGVRVCTPINAQYLYETFSFPGFRAQRYDDIQFWFGQTYVHLMDTSVRGWCLNVRNGNTVRVSDADLNEIRADDQSNLVFDRVRSDVVVAKDQAHVELRNSIINGDVVAKENSTIVLFETAVKGEIVQTGNGRVVIQQ